MRLLPILTVAVLVLAATPAFACRIPQSQFVAAWREEPASAPDALLLHGRLALYGGPQTPITDDSSEDDSSELDALYLFGVLERTDGPPVRVYRIGVRSHCDITPRGVFDQDVWIVGHPLADDGGGDRIALWVLRRSGVWGPE